MRVLVISQYYPPENVPIPHSLAQDLSSAGHSVRVITGFPNYPTGVLFKGYRQEWRKRESDGGVDVLRVPLWADHSQSLIGRMLNYLSFAISSATAFRFARNADVTYVYATQMTAAFGPWLWRIFGGAPYVLHIQDLWPDSITGSAMAGGLTRVKVINSALVPWISSVYKGAGAVVGIAPTMVESLMDRGVPAIKTHMVYNWSDQANGTVVRSRENSGASVGVTNILYAGNVGEMQDLETAILAAHSASDAGVVLTIVGDGVDLDRIRGLSASLECKNIQFHGRVSQENMAGYYRDADYTLVTLKNLPVFRGTIPSKFQASLAHGVPVITTVQGDVRKLVDGLGVGFSSEAEDPKSLEQAFRVAASLNTDERNEMSSRSKSAYDAKFARTAGVGAMEEILRNVCQRFSLQGTSSPLETARHDK